MSLQIRKKSTSSWEHIKDGKNIILSNGSFRFQNNQFELTEISGVDQFDQPRTPLADITLYDDTASGSPEAFTSTTVFIDRLRELGYPFFSSALGGSGAVTQIVAGTNITIDPSDGLGIVTINSTGGGGGDASFDQEVNQVGHGLSVGDVVRMDGANYIKALADTATNAVGIGIVTVVTDADNFTYQYGGLTSINLGLSNGDEALLQDDGSIGTTEGTINLYLGTQTPEGFLIEIGQGFEVDDSNSSNVEYSTDTPGTIITFDKPRTYGNVAVLSGDISFDYTGAKFGASALLIHEAEFLNLPPEINIVQGRYKENSTNYIQFVYLSDTKILAYFNFIDASISDATLSALTWNFVGTAFDVATNTEHALSGLLPAFLNDYASTNQTFMKGEGIRFRFDPIAPATDVRFFIAFVDAPNPDLSVNTYNGFTLRAGELKKWNGTNTDFVSNLTDVTAQFTMYINNSNYVTFKSDVDGEWDSNILVPDGALLQIWYADETDESADSYRVREIFKIKL